MFRKSDAAEKYEGGVQLAWTLCVILLSLSRPVDLVCDAKPQFVQVA